MGVAASETLRIAFSALGTDVSRQGVHGALQQDLQGSPQNVHVAFRTAHVGSFTRSTFSRPPPSFVMGLVVVPMGMTQRLTYCHRALLTPWE